MYNFEKINKHNLLKLNRNKNEAHWIYKFPNGFGLSVITNQYGDPDNFLSGGPDFECAVIKFNFGNDFEIYYEPIKIFGKGTITGVDSKLGMHTVTTLLDKIKKLK